MGDFLVRNCFWFRIWNWRCCVWFTLCQKWLNRRQNPSRPVWVKHKSIKYNTEIIYGDPVLKVAGYRKEVHGKIKQKKLYSWLIARFIYYIFKPMEIPEIHQSISIKGLIPKSDSTLQMLIIKTEAPPPSRFRSVRPKSCNKDKVISKYTKHIDLCTKYWKRLVPTSQRSLNFQLDIK